MMRFFGRWGSKLSLLLLIASGGVLLLSSAIEASSSSSFQVHSAGLVASDTSTNSASTSFQVQGRSKFEQVHGQSGSFQVYSSFSVDKVNNFVLSTTTPVNGNVATITPVGFLNDDVSQKVSRDTKANHLVNVPQLGDHMEMVAALANGDEFVITERRLDFTQTSMQEPVIFFPVDRVSSSSRKNMIAIPGALTMNQNPGFIGPLVEDPLPNIENFDEKYAIDLPTSVPVTFNGNIDVCLYGTPTSTGIATAAAVDVFYSNDNGGTWSEDTAASAKQYVGATDQFCFQTDHLTKFVIGQKTTPVVVPTPAPTTPTSSGGGGGGGQRRSYNPQALLAGVITSDKSYRIDREAGGLENIASTTPLQTNTNRNQFIAFWERLLGGGEKSAENLPEPPSSNLPIEPITPGDQLVLETAEIPEDSLQETPVEIVNDVLDNRTESQSDRENVVPKADTARDFSPEEEVSDLLVTEGDGYDDFSQAGEPTLSRPVLDPTLDQLTPSSDIPNADSPSEPINLPSRLTQVRPNILQSDTLVMRSPNYRCLSPFVQTSLVEEDVWYEDCSSSDKALFWIVWLSVLGALWWLLFLYDEDDDLDKPYFISTPIQQEKVAFKNHALVPKTWKDGEPVIVTYEFINQPIEKGDREKKNRK